MRYILPYSFMLFTTALAVFVTTAAHTAQAQESSRCEAAFAPPAAVATSALPRTTVDADTVLRELARLYVSIEDKLKNGNQALAQTLHAEYKRKITEAQNLGVDLKKNRILHQRSETTKKYANSRTTREST